MFLSKLRQLSYWVVVVVCALNLSVFSFVTIPVLAQTNTKVPDKFSQYQQKLGENNKLAQELQKEVIAGSLVVKFKDSAIKSRSMLSVISKLNLNTKLKMAADKTQRGLYTGQSSTKMTVDKTLEQASIWAKDANVEYAEPLYRAKKLSQETPWGVTTVKASGVTGAWDTNNTTGAGTVVAVVDTGVDYNHPDLTNNMWSNSGEIIGNDIDDDDNSYIDDAKGWDFAGGKCNPLNFTNYDQDNNPIDEDGHGTHVSGIVAAEDNSDFTVGVAPDATIMPVKVLDCVGQGTSQSVASGIIYAVDNGADIINMSLGMESYSRLLEEAVDYAEEEGVLVVAAAGNSYWDYPSYPAAYENVISVAATASDDTLAYFSSFGKVDIAAPGYDVNSLALDGKTVKMSGTSMASPHIAGVAALIKSKHSGYGPDQIRQALESTATDLGAEGKDIYFGSGLVDAEAATNTTYDPSITLRLANRGYIFADGDDSATIKAMVFDDDMAALNGEVVDFETTNADIAGATASSNASGIASQTITSDATENMTVVTVSSENTTTSKISLIINRTDVDIRNAWPSASELTSSFSPGQNIFFSFDLFNNYYEHQDATIDYEITDESDRVISALSGSDSLLVKGSTGGNPSGATICETYFSKDGFPYSCGQYVVATPYLTIPTSASEGKYNLHTTVTVGSVTSEFESSFMVGKPAAVLVIGDSGSYTNIDRASETYISSALNNGNYYMEELDKADVSYTYWDMMLESGMPMDFSPWSAVIAYASPTLNISAFGTYLNSGGKLFLANNSVFSGNSSPKTKPIDAATNLGLAYKSDIDTPTDINDVTSGIFNGIDVNVDRRDWNGTGSGDQWVGQSVTIPNEDFDANFDASSSTLIPATATPAMSYAGAATGEYAAAKISTDASFKAVYMGFGLEGINDASDRTAVMGEVLDYFFPAPTITRVMQAITRYRVGGTSIYGSVDNLLTITGANFSPTGTTVVKVDGVEIGSTSVLDRKMINFSVPADMLAVGWHSVTVVNPDGQSVTKSSAFKTVKRHAPTISRISPTKGYNVKVKTIRIYGGYFYGQSRDAYGPDDSIYQLPSVKIGNKYATVVDLLSSGVIRVSVPKGLKVGSHDVKVINPDGQSVTRHNAYKALAGKYLFSKNLQVGSSGTAVRKLQGRLKTEGFFESWWVPTTYYGDATKAAVKKYQKKHHLVQTGNINTKTRAMLNKWYTDQK